MLANIVDILEFICLEVVLLLCKSGISPLWQFTTDIFGSCMLSVVRVAREKKKLGINCLTVFYKLDGY